MAGYEEQFVGVWKLQDWSVVNLETSAVTEYFDGRASGYIIYTADGWVSSSIVDTGRPMNTDDRDARLDVQRAVAEHGSVSLTPQQHDVLGPFAMATFGYLGYCGPYTADATHVHHKVMSAGRTSHMGRTLTRSYDFSDDTLRLIGDAFGYRDSLLWKRITPAPERG